MDVEVYADPSCPWSWATCLWLDQVSPRRQLRLVLRPFSLALRDGTEHLPDGTARAREQAHRVLRVASALDDDAQRWAFFAAAAGPVFADLARGRAPAFDVGAAAAAAGVSAAVAARADDVDLDARIAAHMRTAREHLPVSDPREQRIPLLVLGPPHRRTAVLGPLLDPAPGGQAAVRLWDAVEALAQVPGVYEVSRPRPASHSLVAPHH